MTGFNYVKVTAVVTVLIKNLDKLLTYFKLGQNVVTNCKSRGSMIGFNSIT